ncbi:AAA family ATPase [Pseudanabaena sp. FACHB-1998]|uniref:AAA family ATPase n=1 Tax=Pseudanabaena sp. FACHB-1998 TaxID=2692858 RepID=UPI001681AA1A|nr:AAA family ATPase [Pseudanabaena sp. FACHB-1998]MBD2179127.1 AAA family ATPase [Pseudanabaena sp. FACHB-1998]
MLNITGYTIAEKIYESNNSHVYRAIRQQDSLPIVIKILMTEFTTSQLMGRYKLEYEITKKLSSDFIVEAYDLIPYQNGFAIILEDFGGESLSDFLTENELELEQKLKLAIQICEGVIQIHSANIIHKDINPSNIVINANTNQLKIIDFGIASSIQKETSLVAGQNDYLEGTLAYMSPEQTGRMNRSLDYRTDLYGMGVTFYQILTQRLPFQSEDQLELIHQHLALEPIPLNLIDAQLPPILSDIILKLLAKNAEQRYQSAWGVKADLEECLKMLQTQGVIEPFELAIQDIADKFLISEKLYGRTEEVKVLSSAMERIVDRDKPSDRLEIILVSGYSGIGKSRLVQEFLKAITKNHGYFITGKFDQYQRNIPYSAFIQAFQNLIKYLLTESAESLNNWRIKLRDTLGANSHLITQVIPNLSIILGDTSPSSEVDIDKNISASESRNRFNLAFQNFISLFAQPEHPLVIFLDDLQWADLASLELLKNLASSSAKKSLLLIGAYRDNEVNAAHPMMQIMELIRQDNGIINHLYLSELNIFDVNQLIADTLHCSPEDSSALAELLQQKTGGNPFFMNEFLKSLYDDRLINFDYLSRRWQWSITKIQEREITDNVVSFMADKILRLRDRTQYLLQIAACIGNQFDIETLGMLAELSPVETMHSLMEAIAEGLILTLGHNPQSLYYSIEFSQTKSHIIYKFAHDRIQQAAYSLIPEADKALLHYEIGKLLLEDLLAKSKSSATSLTKSSTISSANFLENILQDSFDHQIFMIVNQFRLGIQEVAESDSRVYIARLNLRAGHKARLSYAYESGLQYCEVGLQLLGDEPWTDQPQLTQDLYLEATTLACLAGRFDRVDEMSAIASDHIRDILDRAKFVEVQIQSLIARNRLGEAIAIALDMLHHLSVDLPQQPQSETMQQSLANIAQIIAIVGNVLALPQMSDKFILAAMKILSNMASAAYIGSPALYPLIVLKQVELSLGFGNTLETAYAFSTYGLILCVGDDIVAGNQAADIALALMNKSHALGFKAKIFNLIYHFVRPWQESVRQCLAPLLEGYQAGLESGDLEFAAYCVYNHCQLAYFGGENLLKVKQDMQNYGEAIALLKQEIALNFHQIGQQAVLNWLGEAENPLLLKGAVYNEEERLPLHIAAGDRYSIGTFYVQKLILTYHFGQSQEAIAIAKLAKQYSTGLVGAIQSTAFYFYHALTLLTADEIKEADSEIYQEFTQDLEKLDFWATHAPSNFSHRCQLLRAELARISGQRLEAMDLYDQAIASAKANQYIQEEALANELAAKFYLAQNKVVIAKAYMLEAQYAYLQWGGLAKIQHLKNEYPQLLAHITTELTTTTKKPKPTTNPSLTQSSSSKLEHLELSAVLKSSQAIASEINLERLLELLMSILIENAGAQIGYLLLPTQIFIDSSNMEIENEWQWQIEAVKSINDQNVQVVQSQPIDLTATSQDQETLVPVSLVNYVIRTHEKIVLHDATHEGDFQNDSWIRRHQTKSLLCMPLINQGKLIAIVLLENNLVAQAFTPNRVEILHLLSFHAAISIIKAKLLQQQQEREIALQRSERTLQNIVAGTSAVTGDDFFKALAQHIAEALNVKYALVTELVDNKLHTLGFCANGVLLPSISYLPAQTPCEIALNHGEFICNSLVQQMFPEDLDLVHMRADSYMGIALKDTQGRGIGNLCILDTEPLRDIERFGNILQVFAARASAELQRESANKALYELNQSLEMRVNQRTAQLEAANKELESFAYSVSHDLRAPLRAIVGFSRILQEDYGDRLDSEGNRFIKVVRDNAQRMGELIDDLLNLSRLNRKEISRQSISINSMVQRILKDFDTEINNRQVEVSVDDLPDCQADSSLLTQVWINLISNAVKYTSKIANAQIKIGVQSHNQEIIYFIRDNGAGFDMQYADKLFGVFQRMHLEQEFEGTGIGLAIAQRIVQRHGGRIWAEAAVNQGATFYFTVPD